MDGRITWYVPALMACSLTASGHALQTTVLRHVRVQVTRSGARLSVQEWHARRGFLLKDVIACTSGVGPAGSVLVGQYVWSTVVEYGSEMQK